MANPFYIPPQQDPLGGIARNVLTLAEMKQRGDIAERQAGLTQQEINLRGDTNMIARQAAEREAQKLELDRQKLGAQFTLFDSARIGGMVKRLGLDKALGPELEQLQRYGADRNFTMGAAHDDFVSGWDQKKADILNRMSQDAMEKIAKDPAYAESKEGKAQQAIMDMIYADESGDYTSSLLFPGVAEQKAREKANTRAALMTAQNERAKNRYILTDRGLFDTTTQQIVPDTGKIPTLVNVPPGGTAINPTTGETVFTNPNRPGSDRPVSVSPGATLVDPGTGRAIFTAPEKPEKGTTPTEQRNLAKTIADAEEKISLNATNEAAGPQVDLFHQYAEKPYAYAWAPGRLYGGEWKKTQLPKVNGKQVTAKDVYDTAAARGMTFDEALARILELSGAKK